MLRELGKVERRDEAVLAVIREGPSILRASPAKTGQNELVGEGRVFCRVWTEVVAWS